MDETPGDGGGELHGDRGEAVVPGPDDAPRGPVQTLRGGGECGVVWYWSGVVGGRAMKGYGAFFG